MIEIRTGDGILVYKIDRKFLESLGSKLGKVWKGNKMISTADQKITLPAMELMFFKGWYLKL
jgi:hypothetical protein